MRARTLDDWLLWQESLSPRAIDLGLDRVERVARRLSLTPPPGSVFTISGTNGKGSTAGFLDSLMAAGGRATGMYTSPHLVRYNERVCVNGTAVDDECLVDAFATVETARGEAPLTYFEFGTLAAMEVFSRAGSEVWILEVGLGGRLDAVNMIDPDYSLITTVALDHQAWLGQTIEEIAVEKAGIMRTGVPAFYGDQPVPGVIEARARELDTRLRCFARDFDYEADDDTWSWRGESEALSRLPKPDVADGAQLRNVSLVLAAIEAYDRTLLDRSVVTAALEARRPDGRFQVIRREHEWVLDVAHNPQAAAVLGERLRSLADPHETTVVVGMLADKQIESVAAELAGEADRWIVCTVDDPRAAHAGDLAARIVKVGGRNVVMGGGPDTSFQLAARAARPGSRIVVCGSFRIVGPALRWLGLY